MPLFQYNDVSVKINGSGILADSAGISSRNSLDPNYIVGLSQISAANSYIGMAINGPIKNSVSMSYILQTNYNPVFNLLNRLKISQSTTNETPDQIEVAGMSGEGYLSNFSIQVDPNSPVTTNSTYSIYKEFSGTMGAKTVNAAYGLSNISGLAHGYTTLVTGPTNYVTGKIYGMAYECQLNWKPVYVLGNKNPIQVVFLNGAESISLVRDVYTGSQFSGQSLTGYFGLSDKSIDFYGLGYLNGATNNLLQLSLTGFNITNTEMSISQDDFVRVKIGAERYF